MTQDESVRADSSRAGLLARNSLANLVRATSSSATNILLPVLLVVTLTPDAYASWALIWTLGTFVAFLDLGVPTTVQALVGSHSEDGRSVSAVDAVRSGLFVTCGVAVLSCASALAVGFKMSDVFPAMPDSYTSLAAGALLFIVLGQSSTLVSNVASSHFAGYQRSHVPAVVLTPARYLSMVAAWLVALWSQSLLLAALAYSLPLLMGTLCLIGLFLRDTRDARSASNRAKQGLRSSHYSIAGLLRQSGPLVVWSLCMLVITGAGLIIVGRVDFGHVATYSIAALVVGALAGLESAASAPFLPELARMHAKHGAASVSGLVLRFTSINSLLLFGATAAVLSLGPYIFALLGRGADVDQSEGLLLLALLMLGSAIHLSGTPLSLAFIATRTHTRVIVQPVLQAALTLGLSIFGGIQFGALGVAGGVFLGGCSGIVLIIFWSSRAAGLADARRWTLFATGVGKPTACLIPVVGWLGVIAMADVSESAWGLGGSVVCFALSTLALARTSLSPTDRTNLRGRLLGRHTR